MDDVKRKIYLDLFAAPSTLFPIIGGLTALIGSWAIGGHAWLTFGGLAGILAGAGIFATRLIFGLEKLADSAYQYALAKDQARRQQELQQLADRLVLDQDPRTEKLLLHLHRTYEQLASDMHHGRIASAAQGVLQSVEQLFQVCVDHLRRSLELWEDAQQTTDQRRARLLKQREELVSEVEQSVDFLDASLEQLRTRSGGARRSQMARLRDELDESIRIARQAEERLNEIDNAEMRSYERE